MTHSAGPSTIQAGGSGTTSSFYLTVGNGKNIYEGRRGLDFLTDVAPAGLILSARNVKPGNVPSWIQRARAVGDALVDPVNVWDQSPRRARHAEYVALPYGNGKRLSGPFTGVSARVAYASPIVDYQVRAGVTVVIAPYLHAEPSTASMLSESLLLGNAATSYLAQSGQPHEVWHGLSISSSYLLGSQLAVLLGEIAAHTPPTLYLSVATNQGTERPYTDKGVAAGMKAVIGAVRDYGGRVIFARRYSSGILVTALGAHGWSTGLEGNLQDGFIPPLQPPPKGGRFVDRYYVPGLFNSMRLVTRAGLVAQHGALLNPASTYGQRLFAANPSLAALTRDERILLRRHNLWSLKQSSDAAAAGRAPALKKSVTAAETAFKSLPPLAAEESDGHLAAWKHVL